MNPKSKFKSDNNYYREMDVKANKIIRELHPFTFNHFKLLWLDQESAKDNSVYGITKDVIKKHKAEGDIRTGRLLDTSMNAWERFNTTKRCKKFYFDQVTIEWCKQFENWMISNGKSNTTISIYLRNLRTMFNLAIDQGIVSDKLYPFGRNKYRIPKGNNVKKAILPSDLEKIHLYQTEDEKKRKAIDFWMLGYLCNGLNMYDILKIKKSYLYSDRIELPGRSKTIKNMNGDVKPITIMLIPQIEQIILTYSRDLNELEPSDYIFPILHEHMNEQQRINRNMDFIKFVNTNMKKVAIDLDLSFVPKTSFARHSFASMMRNHNISTEEIQDAMGHKDKRTTENYLSNFYDSRKLENQRKLLEFKLSKNI